jgi:hypothetical protein
MSKDEEHALALSIWESEGGAPDGSRQLYQYGRRFEGDGTYAIHHVFTGETVRIDLWTTAGLNPKNAGTMPRWLHRPTGSWVSKPLCAGPPRERTSMFRKTVDT